ncbi:DUF1835 domain-containing protein [Bacillus sp. ISL-75]|uniref:DUF1835 domain-containing protein n=1 Tax=Bacillus sp. ISL-75 TaxID=2819137 RepID=UPI001BEC28BB|nr:DUF1835 domain-containing protein [Bacillus sp. ISL-75]MBT2729855.1 DUF1835 domain-containing protein [Bacillus sp. ISL-75]
MKTRDHYPYVYFFTEPNVVFVYKIEGEDYLTASELSQQGEWETYELRPTDEFESFNHEAHIPLVGRGYFLRQDDLNFMAGKINQLIQSQRKVSSFNYQNKGAFHLVSSAATAGALRVGLDQPKTVIGFHDFFSIGPLWKLDQKEGQDIRFEWLNEHINVEQDDFELLNNFSKTLLEIEDIPEFVPIYIWAANNGNEQTGLRFILHLLKEKDNDIVLLNTTELHHQRIDSNNEKRYSSMLHPNQLKQLLEQASSADSLSYQERIHFQREWEGLAQSKDVLRLWENGRVTSVPEDYFDAHILKAIDDLHKEQENKDFIRTGKVIGETLHQMDELVGEFYLEYRIRQLIYSGFLELKGIPRSMRHYSVKLREK